MPHDCRSGFLSDCISKDQASAELFIVSPDLCQLAKSLRDRFTQAVLSLGEGIINPIGKGPDEVLDNEEFKALVASLGVGMSLGKDVGLDLNYLRYGKIILATDESPQGIYVRDQVLALMHGYMGKVVSSGHVYTSNVGDISRMTESEFSEGILARATRNIVNVKAEPNREWWTGVEWGSE